MSEPFRDLERASRSPEAIIQAAIASFEAIPRAGKHDLARFETLFIPLYQNASIETRRIASAALSRLALVPDAVAHLILDEDIAIAAPFIAHYAALKEPMLAQAIARKGAGHARAAARRKSLSAAARAALLALDDPSVTRILSLREGPSGSAAKLAKTIVDAPALDPSQDVGANGGDSADRPPDMARPESGRDNAAAIRADLKRLALAGRTRPSKPAANDGPENSGTAAEFAHAPVRQRLRPDSAHRQVPAARLLRLEQMTGAQESDWFLTALADAMESSLSLASRILSDLSGRQLATALVALGMPERAAVAALTHYFPVLAGPAAFGSKAEEMLRTLDRDSCRARLEAWQRADAYSAASPVMVPALAPDALPYERPALSRREPGARAHLSRKAG